MRSLKFINQKKSQMLFDSTDFTIDAYHRLVMRRRIQLLKRVRKGINDEGYVFLFPYKGTGDIYMACMYLNDYISKQGIGDHALCVVGGGNVKICKLFGFKNVQSLPQEEMDDLLNLGMFIGFDEARIIVLHADPPQVKSGISDRLRNYNGYNFNDMFAYGVFGPDVKSTLPEFEDCHDEVVEFFEENSLIPGKTVVISPYVNTLDRLPEWFWIELTARFVWGGFTVCTNCAGEEQPTFGSIRLDKPYSKIKSYMEYAGFFVSSRNGLCDVVSSFDCEKVMIYNPYLFWGDGRNIDYFDLRVMGLTDQVVNLEYKGVEFLELMDNVLDTVIGIYESKERNIE